MLSRRKIAIVLYIIASFTVSFALNRARSTYLGKNLWMKKYDKYRSLKINTTIYAKLFPILVNTYFADRYFYINPKSHISRYYKETDSNYHARIRKENSKHVHQEPYSLERIITGVYFVSFISLCKNKFF